MDVDGAPACPAGTASASGASCSGTCALILQSGHLGVGQAHTSSMHDWGGDGCCSLPGGIVQPAASQRLHVVCEQQLQLVERVDVHVHCRLCTVWQRRQPQLHQYALFRAFDERSGWRSLTFSCERGVLACQFAVATRTAPPPARRRAQRARPGAQAPLAPPAAHAAPATQPRAAAPRLFAPVCSWLPL